METMYGGIPFSPQTTLSSTIGAGDSVIPVADISAFPDAPNYATIGTDADGETILYSAKTTTAISGCTRGVEGTAKSWPSGSVIGRNFTNKDFSALQENIKEADALAGACKEAVNAILTAEPFSSSATYKAGNVVTYAGSTWRAKKDSTGQTPAENEYWTCLASKGDKPEKGVDYWTLDDQKTIVDAVLDALPAAEGVSV